MKYAISLAPSGKLRLHYTEELSVDIRLDENTGNILLGILRAVESSRTRTAEKGMPTQAQIDDLVRQFYREQATETAFAIVKEFKL
jgi:hypothetical protein